jgi:hypothetical protein
MPGLVHFLVHIGEKLGNPKHENEGCSADWYHTKQSY